MKGIFMFDKRLIAMCPMSKRYIAGNIFFQWIELLSNAVMIFAISETLENMYYDDWNDSQLTGVLITILSTIVVRFLAVRYSVKMSWLASKSVKKILRERIYSKLLRLGRNYRKKVSTAELVQESVEGVDQLETYFGLYVPQFFYALLAPLTLFTLFIKAGSVKVAVILLICVPLIPVSIVIVQKIAKKLLSKYWGQYTQLGNSFLENLQGMTTLKIYGADGYKNQQMNNESELFRRVTMKVLTMQLNSVTIMDFVAYGGAGLGIILAVLEFSKENSDVSLQSCIFMILLSADFFLPMRKLGSYFHTAMNGMTASDRIFKFLALEEPPRKPELLPFDGGDIVFDHVRFSYDDKREILHGISFRIPKKCLVGIVGESGCGKSTIASLITGKFPATEGRITIANIDINDISEESLMRRITYVGHDSYFFKGTVRENLEIAGNFTDDAKIWEILFECELSTFFRSQNGLDTMLAENASNLSGGQKQRLALARAIIHDSPIYIFDEATSNIDVESEELIIRLIYTLAKKKTVIMISHRLANVAGAERIYVLDTGNIAESGKHRQLAESAGVYAKLWKTQTRLEKYSHMRREKYKNEQQTQN